MNNLGKVAIGIGLTAAVVYAIKLRNIQKSVVATVSGVIHKLSTEGITANIKVKISNPSSETFRVQKPSVQLYHQDPSIKSKSKKGQEVNLETLTFVGGSRTENKTIRVTPWSDAIIENIMIDISLLSSVINGLSIIEELRNGGGLDLYAHVITNVSGSPYEKTYPINLSK